MDFLRSPRLSPVSMTASLQRRLEKPWVSREPTGDFITKTEHELELRMLQDKHEKEIQDLKLTLAQTYSEKMHDFEDTCLEQYRCKVKEIQNSHISTAEVLELKAKLEVYEANEGLVHSKWHKKVNRLEQALEECNSRLNTERAKVDNLSQALDTTNYQLSTALNQLGRLNSSNSLQNEQDKKTIDQLTRNYKRVAMELAEEKLKNRHESENCLKIRVNELENQVKSLEWKRKKDGNETNSEELRQWREKCVCLVTKMYPLLKKLRFETDEIRRNALQTKKQMQEELQSVLLSFKPAPATHPTRRTSSQKRFSSCQNH